MPLFLTARKGLALDGSHPTMLYGYGGFSISTLPTYRSDVPAWLELGGIWVTVNMRGGAEYGEAWHKAGISRRSRTCSTISSRSPSSCQGEVHVAAKLGIMGGSNGGLLVGAVEEQRPDLFAVALPAVGVMDMLRYDKFTGGSRLGHRVRVFVRSRAVRVSDQVLAACRTSRPGTCYPATLVTTADHDDRVVPSHSFKFTAAMQAAQACNRPILIRVETQASHGYRPTDKRIAELADEWAFAAAQMRIEARR